MKHLDEIMNKLEEVKALIRAEEKAPEPRVLYISNSFSGIYAISDEPTKHTDRFVECPVGSVVVSRERVEKMLSDGHFGNLASKIVLEELGFAVECGGLK